MRRALLALTLCLALVCARAAEPVAKIVGPSTAPVGQIVIFDVSGSASDADQPLQVKVKGPGNPSARIYYDSERRPGLAALMPTVPGRYEIGICAAGTAEGAKSLAYDFDVITLDVGAPPPPPTPPTPPPTPDPDTPDPLPVGDYDASFVSLGKALARQFGKDYATALESGAKLLDAGQSRTMAYGTIAKEYSNNRQASLERIASGALDKVSPATTQDKDLTPAQQKALARALRGIAVGAAKP